MSVKRESFNLMFGLSCDFEMLIKHSLLFSYIKSFLMLIPVNRKEEWEEMEDNLLESFLLHFKEKMKKNLSFHPLEHLRRFTKIVVYKSNLLWMLKLLFRYLLFLENFPVSNKNFITLLWNIYLQASARFVSFYIILLIHDDMPKGWQIYDAIWSVGMDDKRSGKGSCA